ncbi:MAG: CooT family nickel-binding protein [Deltaproteobacteria bacterium]|nr:CooT family nickel-binding protein [Deltaproteobacteria bacterium]MBW2144122.1 CooT family nickel-binding protein [Deltaproteobacteria bacterium]
MCESAAYILRDGTEDLIVESVEILEIDNGQVKIRNLFGEERIIKARVKTLSLVDHKIILEPL